MKRKTDPKSSRTSGSSSPTGGEGNAGGSAAGGTGLKILIVIGVLVGASSVAFYATLQLPNNSESAEPLPSAPTPAPTSDAPAAATLEDSEQPVKGESNHPIPDIQSEPTVMGTAAPLKEIMDGVENTAPVVTSTPGTVTDAPAEEDVQNERDDAVADSPLEPSTEQPHPGTEEIVANPVTVSVTNTPTATTVQDITEETPAETDSQLQPQGEEQQQEHVSEQQPQQEENDDLSEAAEPQSQQTESMSTQPADTEEAMSADQQRMEAAIRDVSEKANLTCDQWMEKARELMSQGESSYSAALDTLAMCVFQEPKNGAAMWNMAVLLLKMNRSGEALVQMENAVAADPTNREFRRGAGSLLYNLHAYPQAIKALENYLELNLFTDSWPKMMEDIHWQREDELSFLREADDFDAMLLSMAKLLRCYLELRHLRQADRMYQILITLQPHDHDMMENYATFAFGLGNLWNGVRFMKVYMEHQFYHNNMGTMDEAYDVMTAHMLRLATSGYDSQIVNLARSLLLAGTGAADMIREGCGASLLPDFTAETHTLKQSELVDILGACITDQQLITALLQAGAAKVANNIFGWSSLLHGAQLGHMATFDIMIKEKMDVQHRTLLGMTALHVAALRGHSPLVPSILKAGVKAADVDEYGRSPKVYACELRYAASEYLQAMDTPMTADCPTPVVKTGSSPLQAAAGEWLDTYRTLPEPLLSDSCDIDSIPGDTSAADFFRDYLSLQKPVIIRHGLTNWPALKSKLQRHALDRDYGSLTFKRATVPYADTFGLDYKLTTLHDYLGYLSSLEKEEKSGTAPEKADYIFSSLSADHPLQSLFEVPASLNANATHISTQTVQFYVGPALTGAPPHFHNFAWNGLVYGAKRWFIFPPQKSVYSKQPVLDWYKGYASSSALECTQHAGDVLFVPAMWAHAVINLKESVGFASEFIYGAAEFSL